MKRALAIVVLGAIAALVPFTVATAVPEDPEGRFTSPPRAVAGAPIFVRSITPCPLLPDEDAYQFVRVGISPHTHPDSLSYIESTDADLRPDGSWEVTISAPVDLPHGVTKSYDIHSQCLENVSPHDAPPLPNNTTTTLFVERSTFRYFLRPLYVTGFGPTDVVEGTGPSGTTTTAAVTTSTTAASFSATALGMKRSTTTTTWQSASATTNAPTTVEDPSARWAEIRRELLDRRSSTQAIELASTESAAGPATDPAAADGGIPWWAFALATMLAVGAVVAFGARRTSALSQLDRQASGD